MSMPQGEI